MWKDWTTDQRLERAQEVTNKCIDLVDQNIALNETNAILAYSKDFRNQINITQSGAERAYRLLTNTILSYEFLRLCALWDRAEPNQYSIPTVANLIEKEEVHEVIFERIYNRHLGGIPGNLEPGSEDESYWRQKAENRAVAESQKARDGLPDLLVEIADISQSDGMVAFRQLRNKNLAHALEFIRNVAPEDEIKPILGNETRLLSDTCRILSKLHEWVNLSGFTTEQAYREKWKPHVRELWGACRFDFKNQN